MSGPAASGGGARPEAVLAALEEAVSDALARLRDLSTRMETAEARGEELGELVRRFTGDPEESERLLSRLQALESENGDLRARLEEGRAGVERLLAKIRFLEDQR